MSPVYTPFKPSERSAFYDKKTQQNHLIIAADGYAMTDPMRYTARLLGSDVKGSTYIIVVAEGVKNKDGKYFNEDTVEF